MDERRLRYFLAVVDEGGVTAAARRLHIAQPSLSQAVRSLESELGVQLFHRVGRGIRLSAAGDALVGPARRVLRANDEARNAITDVIELNTGTLEIAALPTLAVDPMAPFIGRFRDGHPGIRVRVLEPESADGVRALVRDGACELGATHLPVAGEQLTSHALGEQELVFIFPPDSAPAGGRSLGTSELAKSPLVVSPPGTSTRMLLEEALAAVGVSPQIAVETAAREAIVPLVLAGAGAALLPARLADEATRRGRSAAAHDLRSRAKSVSSTVRRPSRQRPAHSSSSLRPRPAPRLVEVACAGPTARSTANPEREPLREPR